MYLYSYKTIRVCVSCEHGTHKVGAVRMCILATSLMFCILCVYEWAQGIHTYGHVHACIHTHRHTQFFVLVLYMF